MMTDDTDFGAPFYVCGTHGIRDHDICLVRYSKPGQLLRRLLKGNGFNSKGTRRAFCYVRRRDGNKCHWCLRFMKKRDLTLDHIVPLSRGGTNIGSNLCAACDTCNQLRGQMLPDDPIWEKMLVAIRRGVRTDVLLPIAKARHRQIQNELRI